MKVGKILARVEISPAFFVFLCAYYYFDPAHTFWPFFVAVAAHETGHWILLRILHVPIHKLRFGGSGACLETAAMSWRNELLVAAAGPLTNFLLAWYFLHRDPMAALVNLALIIYNLLPFYPLDGGRILRCLLQLLLRGGRAVDLMERIICGCCLGLFWCGGFYFTCVLHEGLWPVLLCALLTVRISETIFPKHRIFPNKRVDKSNFA